MFLIFAALSNSGIKKKHFICTLMPFQGTCLANAGINFIQNHPPPGTNPRDTTRREQKPSPRDNNCVQKPFPRDKTGSQKPHPRDIKLENPDTISNEKLCRLNK